jgi:hypothetical protein
VSEANMKTPIFQAHGDADYTVSSMCSSSVWVNLLARFGVHPVWCMPSRMATSLRLRPTPTLQTFDCMHCVALLMLGI